MSLTSYDLLLEERRREDSAARVFERFMHWGYWENPRDATGEIADYVQAMDRLNAQILSASELRDHQAVLDAGCGIGGTLASINESRSGMCLAGVNIAPRQIAIAREAVQAKNNNSILFVEADACSLPFTDGCFDRVLAVECIFHFPSRLSFLKEASRVLRTGGRLALSDFIPLHLGDASSLSGQWLRRQISSSWGTMGSGWVDGSYREMGCATGLDLELERDITIHTLPTYPLLLSLMRASERRGLRKMIRATRLLEWLSRTERLQYKVIKFRKM
ncbi:type 11 methyltransferase [Candidatus Methylomirabilis lanthanidiphila]|uniref:Type 11 methyltransferase n=1 Tax=Candidatus Methylomirabilis lanthanidiphila TaxID=2211376 RepID=A0A564ZN45_9BACT|nr:class I SAM-dependent methyltransferase [Candidatus Methylomirabilis lanthanidiphila]VUZ86633.1 type 11 methyltransferase [Candidatus Methylomirabilis lanthanidiphila]